MCLVEDLPIGESVRVILVEKACGWVVGSSLGFDQETFLVATEQLPSPGLYSEQRGGQTFDMQ